MSQRRPAAIITGLALPALAVLAVFCYLRGAQRNQVSQVRFLMDTVVEVNLYGRQAQAAAQELFSELEAIEAELSCHRPDSALARVNAAAGSGQPVALSSFGYQTVAKAREIAQRYGGYDATIAPVTALWGITGSSPRVPAQEEIDGALALVGWQGIELDGQQQAVQLTGEGQALDLGGIVKGAASGAMLPVLEKYGIRNGYVSLGGNLLVLGRNPQTGKDFTFGLRDPFGSPEEYFATITLPNGATMATAGGYERYFEQDGVRYHHILDPATGYPSRSDLVSVTVVSADGALADALSTALFVGGSKQVLRYLDDPAFGLVAVDSGRRVYLSPALRERFALREDAGFTLAG